MARSDRFAIATLALAAALAAPPAVRAGPPDPTGDVLFSVHSPWREAVARALASMRPVSPAAATSSSVIAAYGDDAPELSRIKVRASTSVQPKVNLALPLARLSGGEGGIDLSGQARRPRAGLAAPASAERTLWNASLEAWHDIGPVTAYAGTGLAREWNAFDGAHRVKNAYAGVEWEAAGLWGLELGRYRAPWADGDESETRLSWRQRIARGWSAGIEATELRGEGWRDRRVGLSVRGTL